MLTSGGSSGRSRSTAKTRASAIATAGTCSANRSCLARRLIQAGVPIVQANMGHMNNWDTHTDNCKQLKTRLLPPLDQGGLGIPRRPRGARSARRDAGGDGRRVRPHAQDRPEQHQRSHHSAPAATTGPASSRRYSPAAACAAAR